MAAGWDVIVVGAGSAGSVVALRLAERGRRVLLLEAGPDFPDGPPDVLARDLRVPVEEYDWGYVSEGDRVLPLPRGKVVGGSSAANSVAAVRWQPADLDAWGFPEWTFAACLPAMCRLEDDVEYGHRPYHGRGGPIRVERTDASAAAPLNAAFHEACLASGFPPCPDQNEPGATGVGAQPFNIVDGARHSTLVTYIRAARALAGFTLRAQTLVDRVLIREGRSTGVALAGGERLHADEVIVCAGAYATPAILMRSGIGPAEHLREVGIDPLADVPAGEGLQDHPAMGLPAIAADARDLGSTPRERFMIRLSFSQRPGAEDVHVFGPIAEDASRIPMPPSSYVIATMVVKPLSRGTVRLRSADPGDPPRITLNYFAEPEDLAAFVRSFLLIEELLEQPSMAKLTSSLPWRPSTMAADELRKALRAAAQTDHHPTGTCPIGPVLDSHLRVHGVESLRVCDASVMPETPRANTNLPTMAVAERFIELYDAEL